MPSSRRFWFGVGIAVICVLSATGVALANFITISDGNKTRGPLDITSASAGHASSTKLLHSFRTRGRIPRSNRAGFCLRVYFRKPTDRGGAGDRVICATGRDEEAHIVAGGIGITHSMGFVRIIGDGNGRALRFRQSSLVGNRNHYWWALDTSYSARRGPCGGQAGCNDSAPNGARTILHSLG